MADIRYTISVKDAQTKDTINKKLKERGLTLTDVFNIGVVQMLDQLCDVTEKEIGRRKADEEVEKVKAYLESMGYDSSTLKKKKVSKGTTKKTSAKEPVQSVSIEDKIEDVIPDAASRERYFTLDGNKYKAFIDKFGSGKYKFYNKEGKCIDVPDGVQWEI